MVDIKLFEAGMVTYLCAEKNLSIGQCFIIRRGKTDNLGISFHITPLKHYVASDLGLYCLPMTLLGVSR